MGSKVSTSREACSCLRRLTDEDWFADETQLFRIEVTSSDGIRVPVTFQVNHKKRELYPWDLKQIADLMRVDRKDVSDRLRKWSKEDLRANLQKHTAQQLLPPARMPGSARKT